MIVVSGDLEAPLALGTNTVQLHELLHPVLARRDAARPQFAPDDARPAVSATRLGVLGLDMHQQRPVAQVAPLRTNGTARQTRQVRVAAGRADQKHPALHRDRPPAAVLLNEGVLQIDPLAKYAVAFPRMSRSIFTRASSALSRLISICSALTGALLLKLL